MTHATKAIYRWLLSDYVKVRWDPRHWGQEVLPLVGQLESPTGHTKGFLMSVSKTSGN